jgi:heat shock protein HslJ
VRSVLCAVTVAVLASGLAACSGDHSSSDSGSGNGGRQATITGVVWVLDTAALVRGAGHVTVTASFDGTQVAGESGCNRYFAPYTANARTGAMKVGTVGGTLMACTGAGSRVETAYLAALPKAVSYRATATKLTLLDASDRTLLTYAATDGAKAIQGHWEVTSYDAGTALVSPVAGASATAKFDGTQISGTGGCNTFSGPYSVDGDAITVGPLASTLRACADPAVEQQEQHYLQALALAKTFAVAGDRLDLFREDGGFAVSFLRAGTS